MPRKGFPVDRDFRWIFFEHGCQQMAFHVVDCYCRPIQCHGDAATGGGTDQQCADQSRPGCIGNAVNIRTCQPGLCKALVDQRQQLADMITRGDFGYDPAVFRVDFHLAEQGMRAQTGIAVVQRYAGFITGCFYAKYDHRASSRNWIGDCKSCGPFEVICRLIFQSWETL